MRRSNLLSLSLQSVFPGQSRRVNVMLKQDFFTLTNTLAYYSNAQATALKGGGNLERFFNSQVLYLNIKSSNRR